MTSTDNHDAPAEKSSKTERFAEWLLEREKARNDVEVDRTYRMLKINTFLTLGILAILGGQDSTELVMSLIWFI